MAIELAAWLAPYTKVEESFNVQAVHDLLYRRADLAGYDHLAFPGVVPRTFLGALALAGAAAPAVAVAGALGAGKLAALRLVRLTLGLLSFASFAGLAGALERRFRLGTLFLLVTAAQFHLPFYASRPLPNTWALILSNLAFRELLLGHAGRMMGLLVLGTVAFRCDLLLLTGPATLLAVGTGQIGFLRAAAVGVAAGLAALLATVLVDSAFWGRPVWPEGEVLFFNTVENRSSEWGVSAWHWYFSSALSRALLGALPFVPVGLALDRRVRWLGLLALLFAGLYSLLGHKELRFLFPALPLLNVAAAAGVRGVLTWAGRRGRAARAAARLGVAGALGASALVAAAMLHASRLNYPGGAALERLHAGLGPGEPLDLHIGVLPAMTGVSRFGEEAGTAAGGARAYSKEEGEGVDLTRFSHLLSGRPSVPGFERVEAVPGFAGLRVGKDPGAALQGLLAGRLPVEFVTEPQVFVHKRRPPP